MTRLFLSLLGLLVTTPVFSDEPDKNLHLLCMYPTVTISQGSSSGTGVIVRSEKTGEIYNNVVITCEHVVSQNYFCSIGFCKYLNWSTLDSMEVYRGYVYKKNEKYDLAVVIFESKEKMPTAELDIGDKHYIGNQVFKFGFGYGQQIRYDEGQINSVNFPLNNIKHFRSSVYTLLGDSGSGLFDKDYKLFALTKGIFGSEADETKHYHINFSIPLEYYGQIGNSKFVLDKKERIPTYPAVFSRLNKIKSTLDELPIEDYSSKVQILIIK